MKKQDEFALVVDVKTKPGMEREYERLMMEVVERQTSEPTYIGTSVHCDPGIQRTSSSTKFGAIAKISKPFRRRSLIDAPTRRVWSVCWLGLGR